MQTTKEAIDEVENAHQQQQLQSSSSETSPIETLNADERWTDALKRTKLQTVALESLKQDETANKPSAKLKRAAFVASELQGRRTPSPEPLPELDERTRTQSMRDLINSHKTVHEKVKAAKKYAYSRGGGKAKPIKIKKKMEQQHWLELIDLKHRYGSNLQYYHEAWVRQNTNEGFQFWLDHGGGKNLSLPECSRDKLESEQIHYLSVEERMHYRVIIKDGLFKFAHPHPQNSSEKRPNVDTTPGKWVDSDGQGLYPRPPDQPLKIEPGKKVKEDFIYVADGNYNIYIGIKKRGRLQHSSFLSGGPISSAGTLVVENGLAIKFSPMSGHYRTKTDSFQRFIDHLKAEGADLSKVHLTATKVLLWGVQRANTYHALKKKLMSRKRDLEYQHQERKKGIDKTAQQDGAKKIEKESLNDQ